MHKVIERIDKSIQRFSQIFQVQTHEVITDLNQIKEVIEENNKKQVVKEPKKNISDTKKQSWVTIGKEEEQTVTEPKKETQEEKKEEKKDVKQLREEYKEKYWKNPFNWWDEEVLISKLK